MSYHVMFRHDDLGYIMFLNVLWIEAFSVTVEHRAPTFLEDSGLTWCPKLGLAGRAGQWQALAKPVHPVEADGDVGLRHGFQIFSWRKGYPTGLVSKSRLCWAESCHARCAGLWDTQISTSAQIKNKPEREPTKVEQMSWGNPCKDTEEQL